MDIERETAVEAGASVLAVLVFIAAVVVVGQLYETADGLSQTGGLAVVGTILLFVLVMTVVGYWFANQYE
ncbi:MAG: transporter [Haloarculaceae archaeon]